MSFYKDIPRDELMKEVANIYKSKEFEQFKILFTIKCKKCNSEKVSLYIKDESSMGSELTGYMEDITVGVKCLECGTAWTTSKTWLEI